MADPRKHQMPPLGVKLTESTEKRGTGLLARVRWTDPHTKKRPSRSEFVATSEEAEAFFEKMRQSTETGANTLITLKDYVDSIGDRWQRGLDPTSTVEGYDVGLRLRVLPALGHLKVSRISTGLIDRTIDRWETEHGPSTVKNSIAPLVRVLDVAVRDEVIPSNPARTRARRTYGKDDNRQTGGFRVLAIPDLDTLNRLAEGCGEIHQSYSDHVMLCALLSARGSEVAGLRVGDIDWANRVVTIERQTYPGKGGLVTKETKGRRTRYAPILDTLEPILIRLSAGKEPDEPLLRGPRRGVITTATLRDATNWDALVTNLGLENLKRHGLRHTGATWLADSGVPLHVLQRILGHASIETTKGYLHPDHRHLNEAAQLANQFLAKPTRRRRKENPQHPSPRL
ncbi:Tyrosine recombinase XerC [Microbacterium azadirachtae]|uniref:Tyrosine recombinase XerC n=1 Tax=Microbacterium azadirachtae TaxID=582680 RepID=A0A0F0L1D6_9MICO|nr:site-specific integrase [Microbacterium azadirachtae]KJL26489.1 Tyrosine recombinase XerC [Microbacterium azadirachtae]